MFVVLASVYTIYVFSVIYVVGACTSSQYVFAICRGVVFDVVMIMVVVIYSGVIQLILSSTIAVERIDIFINRWQSNNFINLNTFTDNKGKEKHVLSYY